MRKHSLLSLPACGILLPPPAATLLNKCRLGQLSHLTHSDGTSADANYCPTPAAAATAAQAVPLRWCRSRLHLARTRHVRQVCVCAAPQLRRRSNNRLHEYLHGCTLAADGRLRWRRRIYCIACVHLRVLALQPLCRAGGPSVHNMSIRNWPGGGQTGLDWFLVLAVHTTHPRGHTMARAVEWPALRRPTT